MTKEELQAKIEQNKTDQKKLKDEQARLEQDQRRDQDAGGNGLHGRATGQPDGEKEAQQEQVLEAEHGLGHFVCEYASQKFNQICAIHAEAYGSAEFRHGPLAMLDEDEATNLPVSLYAR